MVDPMEMRCDCACHLFLKPACDIIEASRGCCCLCMCGARIKHEYWDLHVAGCRERARYKDRKYRREQLSENKPPPARPKRHLEALPVAPPAVLKKSKKKVRLVKFDVVVLRTGTYE